MISNPNQYANQFVNAGADSMTFHIEALPQPTNLLSELKQLDIVVGLAINPSTDFQCVLPFVPECDLVLTMSVEAGFGGQAFNPIALERISYLRKTFGPQLLLEVDGGVNEKSIGLCTSHGADLLVVGSALFRQADYCQAMTRLISAMQPMGSA
jgi:ribulose-phosphate 3-epimerase